MDEAPDSPTHDARITAESPRAGELLDVFLRPPTLADRWLSPTTLAFGLSLCLYWVLTAPAFRRTLDTGTIAMLVAPAIVLSFVMPEFWLRQRIRGFARLRSRLDLNSFVMEFLRRHREVRVVPRWTHRLAEALGKTGFVGDTVRLVSSKSYSPIRPLDMTFEPRELDEGSAGFLELEGAHSDAHGGRRASGSAGWRRARRGLVMAGGWPAMAGFAFMLLGFGLIAGRTTASAATEWALLIAAPWVVVFLARALSSMVQQFLLVPGGLIVRRSGWFGRRWRVNLFDRRQCVLIAREFYREHRWLVTVADCQAAECMILTRPEVDLLLAAWLSRLSPPPVQRLSDLHS